MNSLVVVCRVGVMFAQDFCEPAAMSSEPQVYAAKVLAAFEQAGLYTDAEIGTAGGPSTSTMTKIRKAAAGQLLIAEPRGDTHRRIDKAAKWPAGSSRKLWHLGQEPEGHDAAASFVEKVRQSNLDDEVKAYILGRLGADEPPPPAEDVG